MEMLSSWSAPSVFHIKLHRLVSFVGVAKYCISITPDSSWNAAFIPYQVKPVVTAPAGNESLVAKPACSKEPEVVTMYRDGSLEASQTDVLELATHGTVGSTVFAVTILYECLGVFHGRIINLRVMLEATVSQLGAVSPMYALPREHMSNLEGIRGVWRRHCAYHRRRTTTHR